jgi:pyrroloquinoline quinone biosynthesis protein D
MIILNNQHANPNQNKYIRVKILELQKPKLKQWMRLKKNHNEPEPYMLLYPEGRVLLNTQAYEILSLCDGNHNIDDIVDVLSEKYPNVNNEEVYEFIDISTNNLWFESKPTPLSLSAKNNLSYWDQGYFDDDCLDLWDHQV